VILSSRRNGKVLAVGFRFSLILNRTVTDDETVALREAGCAEAVFGTDTLPTDAAVTVARLDFDDTTAPSLAEAIEFGLEAVVKVPDLSVPGLSVPAQPAHRDPADPEPAAVVRDDAEPEEPQLVEAAAAD
jgi:hypothetical protein